jgi:ParB/RepB/Spo0J family partition protein
MSSHDENAAEPTAEPTGALRVPLDALAPDPHQPRRVFLVADLETLAASLRARGVIQPLLVSPHPDATTRRRTPYQIVTGERRWAAARLAGLDTVPVVVREEPLSPADRLMLQLDENDGELRKSLTLYDRAQAVARAVALSGLEKRDFAHRHRKSAAWCSHYLKLAHATGSLADALREGYLTGILTASLFDRLTTEHQLRLLAAARRTGLPITPQQIEVAAQRFGPTTTTAAPPASTVYPAPAASPASTGRDSRHLLQLTTPQLDALLVRLGRRPHGSPDERVEQLYACLA